MDAKETDPGLGAAVCDQLAPQEESDPTDVADELGALHQCLHLLQAGCPEPLGVGPRVVLDGVPFRGNKGATYNVDMKMRPLG